MTAGARPLPRCSATNLDRFLSGIARRKSWTPRHKSVEFTYRGRPYVAIRYRGGKVELYRAAGADGIEAWMRYAVRGRSGIDRLATELLEDELDPAAVHARMLLLEGDGSNPYVRNVRMGPAYREWGSVIADFTDPHTGVERPIYASIKLYTQLGNEPVDGWQIDAREP